MRVKTAQNSKRSKASNAWSRAVRELKSLRGLEACNLVTAAIVISTGIDHTHYDTPETIGLLVATSPGFFLFLARLMIVV
jgi:hypothetical protein